jgi:hypothetical protein
MSVAEFEQLVEEKLGTQKRNDGSSNADHAKRVRAVLLGVFAATGEQPSNAYALEVGALGHDLLEDSPITREELYQHVGDEGLRFIEEMTNQDGDDHTEGYVAQMIVASEEARLIKYADLCDNLLHASYQAPLFKPGWMGGFFLPIVDPMREALHGTAFTLYPKTAQLLRSMAEVARAHLQQSIENNK